MKPTEVLMREHRIIEQVLNCLEVLAHRAEAEATLDTEAAAQAIDFFRTFADRCHHGKEETHLFPMMEAKGFSPEAGPTAVMRIEHDQGRSHVRAMDEAVGNLGRDAASARQQFITHARDFVQLLREHIQKEDTCLFPMADQALDATDQQTLTTSFEKVAHEEIGPEIHTRCVELANRLADRLGVSKVPEAGGR